MSNSNKNSRQNTRRRSVVRRSKVRRKEAAVYSSLETRNMLASVGFDGAGQGSAELTYFLGEAPAEIGQDLFESTIEDALQVYADVVDVTFTRTTRAGLNDSLDITFRNIDGAGGTLAQAFFPDDVNPARIAGDIQFDISEDWEVGNDQGAAAFDLLNVAVHEIGHALGLGHDDSVNSVLFPSVSPNTAFSSLDQVDVDSILELYAPAVQTPVADLDPVEPADPVADTDGPADDAPETDAPETDEPQAETPAGDQPDSETPADDQPPTDDPVDDRPEEDEDESEDESEEEDRADEERRERFRRRLEAVLNQWFRRLRQFGFRFRFR